MAQGWTKLKLNKLILCKQNDIASYRSSSGKQKYKAITGKSVSSSTVNHFKLSLLISDILSYVSGKMPKWVYFVK